MRPIFSILSSRPRAWLIARWQRPVSRALIAAALSGLLCLVLLLTLLATVNVAMVDSTKDSILLKASPTVTTEAIASVVAEADLSGYDCILVLGAGVREDGTPSDMLRHRVMVGCTLYEALSDENGSVPLLMSGDHSGDYNEVGVMKQLATDAGIPGEDVFLDHAGYSTYESLWRAKEVFGARRILIVSQSYHLHRAIYIAESLGLEAVGVPADLRTYRHQTRYELRESLARFKDLFASARRKPVTTPGLPVGPVDLSGNGNDT